MNILVVRDINHIFNLLIIVSYYFLRFKICNMNDAEKLNKLFMRNKDINMLLSYEDRHILEDSIKIITKNNHLNLLQTFLTLQVCNIFIFNFLFIKNY